MLHDDESRDYPTTTDAAPISRAPRWALPLAGGLALLAAACSGGGGGGSSSGPAGSTATNPGTGLKFVIDPNSGGGASELEITGVFWGRLVDIYDRDPVTMDRTLQFDDFLIGQDITSDGIDYLLERNPVTEQETLTILHPADSVAFSSAFQAVDANLQLLLDKSLAPTQLPPYTAIPRNAAMAVRFDDLLSDGGDPSDPTYPGTVTRDTLRLLVGYPPETPFEARILPDPSHGDIVNGQFHSTRVLIDFTVSSLESQQSSGSLMVNSLGLPEAVTTDQPNGVLRIPTRKNAAAGQPKILLNLSGHAVSFNGNGSNDPTSPTQDVVRAFRSQGKTSVTGDPNNGFLPDDILPEILGSQVVAVTQVSPGPSPDQFVIDLGFQTPSCATRPQPGDVLQLGNHLAEVTQLGSLPQGGVVTNVHVELLFGEPATFGIEAGVYRTPWNAQAGGLPACFVRFSPEAGIKPNLDVPTGAQVVVTFSEPMDPRSVQAFDTFTVAYATPPSINPLFRLVVGAVLASGDVREFSFQPSLPLRHVNGLAEKYFVDIAAGLDGVTDLAGNPLAQALPQVEFLLAPNQATQQTLGLSLRFTSSDEDLNGAPELRGQVLFDFAREVIKPRSVTRFSALADPSVPIVGAMIPFTAPVQTPLSDLGSKMMGVYRYHDFGFGLLDDNEHNLDLEGLNWAPFNSGLQIDNFEEFQMSVAHSKFLPDEWINPASLLPGFTISGLVTTFDSNLLDPQVDPLTVVHAKPLGYEIRPLDAFTAPTGTLLAPWPLNRNKPLSQYVYWTWRDTAKLPVGAPFGSGADTSRYNQITGLGNIGFYPVNQVPTIGLPLLVEYRTYPSDEALGLNGFQVALAINSSAQPNFRVFSTGGVGPSGPVQVNPDTESVAKGGINPNTGANTDPQDNVFYYGQGDFVTRISRAHTIWFDTTAAHTFAPAVFEPLAHNQPTGTQVVLAFRGASAISSTGMAPWENAQLLSPYGDSWTAPQAGALGVGAASVFTPTYVGGSGPTDKGWKSTLAGVNGARYVQVRLTFRSNAQTNLSPELSALGLAFTQ